MRAKEDYDLSYSEAERSGKPKRALADWDYPALVIDAFEELGKEPDVKDVLKYVLKFTDYSASPDRVAISIKAYKEAQKIVDEILQRLRLPNNVKSAYCI